MIDYLKSKAPLLATLKARLATRGLKSHLYQTEIGGWRTPLPENQKFLEDHLISDRQHSWKQFQTKNVWIAVCRVEFPTKFWQVEIRASDLEDLDMLEEAEMLLTCILANYAKDV